MEAKNMFVKNLISSLLLVLISLPHLVYSQPDTTNLDAKHISACVYEVIVPKPTNDSLTYEKPLPLDLIPFAIRNDKYYSIGTAFAYNETEFVTAGHVMNVWQKSQFGEICIRDTNGNVFSLDKVTKFSSRRDFMVFTVKGRISEEHLEINPSPELNEKVYAVGNALGQGVVIRDGLYTSNTPEEVDGTWNWIRFSAAASPGNSGGPLLDKNGKLVGVILSKSPNENLNLALPITEVQKDYEGCAEIYDKGRYSIDIMDVTKSGTLNTKVKLPMSFGVFKDTVIGIDNEFLNGLSKDMLAENKDQIFPNGTGSNKLLYKNTIYAFPQLIVKQADGNWDTTQPQKISTSELDNNGKIESGAVRKTVFLKIQKPDNISLSDFCSDSKSFMDMILKTTDLPRVIGPEKVRIISMGKADNEYMHVDSYGRKWLVKTWPLEYCDQVMVVFALPVPGGCVAMLTMGQTGRILDEMIPDLKLMTDFIYLSFDGTLRQWREYLEMKELVPSFFKDVDLVPNDDSFRFKSKRLGITCDTNSMKINEQSFLEIGFGYFRENDKVIWDATKVILLEGKFKKNGFAVSRNMKPNNGCNEKYIDNWQKLVDGQTPYDMKTYMKNESTVMSTVYKRPDATNGNKECSVLYDISCVKSGVVDQSEMESDIGKIVTGISVYEN
jgi:serine protease Do